MTQITYRVAQAHDGPELWRIAKESQVLDVNSPYAYVLMATMFGDTCVVAELDGKPVGFVSGILPPKKPDVVFVWQVGVDAAARGHGVGRKLLETLVELPICEDRHALETTITPSNAASDALFRSFARHRGAEVTLTEGYFGADLLSPMGGEGQHEPENLYRIGPLHAEKVLSSEKLLETINTLESEVRGYVRGFPTVFKGSQGVHLVNVEGQEYLDFFSGAGALNYGHNPAPMIEAAKRYLERGGVMHSLDMATDAKIRFLDTFQDVILKPRELNYKVQFPGPTGTNAVESALKLARKVTGRQGVISFTNAFHGMTLGSLAVTGNAFKRKGGGVSVGHTNAMPFEGFLGEDVDTLDLLETYLVESSSGVDLPAAILVETVQGEGGLNAASVEWLQRLAALAKEHEILLIVDDIQAGCGRTGSFFSFEPAGVKPDMVTLSKSISGVGQPMALVLFRPELDIWAPGEHNGTFRGNNLAFVTATAALEHFWKDSTFMKGVAHKARLVTEGLQAIAEEHDHLETHLRGRGLMQGLEFEDEGLASEVAAHCFERGLILETSGSRDQVLKLLPPLTITPAQLKRGLKVIAESLKAALVARGQVTVGSA